MPNIFDANGLQVQTRDELIAFFTAKYQQIYGVDVNLASNTPDGQMMNIYIQSILDLEDLLVQINNQFDPDEAVGVILDQRVTLNGIQREGGTYTTTPVTLVTDRSLNLYGLDQADQPIYTVADNAGTRWQLVTTTLGLIAGTHVLEFRAALPGAQLTVPNTIDVPVTVVLGVTSINNPTTYTTLGINEETDAVLKLRRQKSVSKQSQGYLAGLYAALLNINGVTSAFVYENRTDLTDGDGTPGHCIWVIVAGSGAAVDIADAIYTKRNAGANMRGDTLYDITEVNGNIFTVRWDDVIEEDVYVKFTVTSLDGVVPPDIAAIRLGLVTKLAPGVFEPLNVNEVATAVQQIDANTLVTNAGLSLTNGSYQNVLTPSSKRDQFRVTQAKIYIVPMQLTPVGASVIHGQTQQFTALGGLGAYTYSISVNNSGGSINAGTGLYTAGATPSVTDTIHAIDGDGNSANTTVSVT